MEERYFFNNRQPLYATVGMVTIELGTKSEKLDNKTHLTPHVLTYNKPTYPSGSLLFFFLWQETLPRQATSCTHPVRQTSDLCKAPPLRGSGKAPASPAGVQGIVFSQENSNLRPNGNATKTKALTTWANRLGLPCLDHFHHQAF